MDNFEGLTRRRFDPYPHGAVLAEVRSECGVDLQKRGRAQVLIEGGSRQTWETPLTSGDADLIIIEGSWPLPPRGQ